LYIVDDMFRRSLIDLLRRSVCLLLATMLTSARARSSREAVIRGVTLSLEGDTLLFHSACR
jgi:hypothetical protein